MNQTGWAKRDAGRRTLGTLIDLCAMELDLVMLRRDFRVQAVLQRLKQELVEA
jgi:hypothetical protein